MKEIPITKRNIFALIVLIAITAGFTWLLFNFISTTKDEPAEETIELKYSKKGLYLFPRFEIMTSNSEHPTTVTKEQFESIETGDTISGYMKNEETFITDTAMQNEVNLGYIILIVLYIIMISFCGGLLKNAKLISKSPKLKSVFNKTIKISLFAILAVYITVGLVFTLLTATNIFHKLNQWNQTEAEATVMGGDYNTTRSNRGGSYTTYELFMLYQDDQGESHITKKAVTGNTYNKYEVGESIPLTYRNNHVYDTFIQTEKFSEIFPAFLNLYTFFIGGYLVSLFFMIRAWLKKKRKRDEQENDQISV